MPASNFDEDRYKKRLITSGVGPLSAAEIASKTAIARRRTEMFQPKSQAGFQSIGLVEAVGDTAN